MKIQTMPVNLLTHSHAYSYMTLYGRTPPLGFLPFSTESESDTWENITKDIHLNNSWIDRLNKINGIEIYSTCEGHSRLLPTHLIFRIKNTEFLESSYNRLLDLISKETKIGIFQVYENICCCLTTYNWYRTGSNNYLWEEWWKSILFNIEEVQFQGE